MLPYPAVESPMKGGLVWFDGCSVLPLLFETSGEGDLESGEESIALNQENETPPVMDLYWDRRLVEGVVCCASNTIEGELFVAVSGHFVLDGLDKTCAQRRLCD